MNKRKLMKGTKIASQIYSNIQENFKNFKVCIPSLKMKRMVKLISQQNRGTNKKILIPEHTDKVPGLGIIQVGDRPDSSLFISKKIQKCETLGFNHNHIKLPSQISKGKLNRKLN